MQGAESSKLRKGGTMPLMMADLAFGDGVMRLLMKGAAILVMATMAITCAILHAIKATPQ